MIADSGGYRTPFELKLPSCFFISCMSLIKASQVGGFYMSAGCTG